MYNKYKLIMIIVFTITALALSFFSCKDDGSDKKKTNSPYQSVSISPSGGTYELEDDITITVPAGAVSEKTKIQIRKVDTAEITALFENRGIEAENIIAGFDALPEGTTFASPIKVKISGVIKDSEHIPIIHYIDLTNKTYTMNGAEATYDPEASTIEFTAAHFTGMTAEEVRELERQCAGNCRCGQIKVKSEDLDYACSQGDCQIAESKVSVTYLDCPEPAYGGLVHTGGGGRMRANNYFYNSGLNP